MSNDSVLKTFLVSVLMCVICSILVSAAAVTLRPVQEVNQTRDRQKNILQAMGVWEKGASVDALFSDVQSRVIDIDTGEFDDSIDPENFSQREAAKAPETSKAIPAGVVSSGLKRRAKKALVYIYPKDGPLQKLVLPVHGNGLWSTMYGFIALGADLNHVVGFSFYEHGETPGLGGEVDNPAWKAQWPGKEIYGADGDVVIRLIKGGADRSSPNYSHQVDGLSGATITSRGVTDLLRYWMGDNGFGPFIEKLKQSKGGMNG